MPRTGNYPKEIADLINNIGDCARHLHSAGWAEATAGNLSIDVSGRMNKTSKCRDKWILVTRSGCRFRETQEHPWADLLVMRYSHKKGMSIEYSGRKGSLPTSEMSTHLLIHKYYWGKKIFGKAVIHAHPVYIVSLTHLKVLQDGVTLNRLLASLHPEFRIFIPEGIAHVPYAVPGSERIARGTKEFLGKNRVMVWEKHGCISIADDLDQSLDLIMIVEKAARIFFIARSAGYELEGLSEKQIRALNRIDGS